MTNEKKRLINIYQKTLKESAEKKMKTIEQNKKIKFDGMISKTFRK